MSPLYVAGTQIPCAILNHTHIESAVAVSQVRVPAADENVLRDRRFGVPVSSVWTTKDGQCYDEM